MRKTQYALMLFILLILCTTGCRDVSSKARMTKKEVLSKFMSAESAYKKENYHQAILLYEEILESGQESGPIYYNLANSYFRNGNLGKAVLNYERAKRLIPRDSDLNFNVKYAYSYIAENPSIKKDMIQRFFIKHVEFYTLDEMVAVMTLAGLFMGILFLLSLYLRWPGNLKVSLMVIFGILFFIHLIGFVYKCRMDKGLAIVLDQSESKFEPREDSTTHFVLTEGTKVRILKKEDNWMKIERLDGKLGWVKQETIERI